MIKKTVRLLSTFHAAKHSHSGKLKCIVKYNKYMCGVDLNDMLIGFYADKKSVNVWKKVVFILFQRFMTREYVARKQFIGPTLIVKAAVHRIRLSFRHWPVSTELFQDNRGETN